MDQYCVNHDRNHNETGRPALVCLHRSAIFRAVGWHPQSAIPTHNLIRKVPKALEVEKVSMSKFCQNVQGARQSRHKKADLRRLFE
jgi:hypothetical protein